LEKGFPEPTGDQNKEKKKWTSRRLARDWASSANKKKHETKSLGGSPVERKVVKANQRGFAGQCGITRTLRAQRWGFSAEGEKTVNVLYRKGTNLAPSRLIRKSNYFGTTRRPTTGAWKLNAVRENRRKKTFRGISHPNKGAKKNKEGREDNPKAFNSGGEKTLLGLWRRRGENEMTAAADDLERERLLKNVRKPGVGKGGDKNKRYLLEYKV